MATLQAAKYRHVLDLWKADQAAPLGEVDLLVYRSNLLGSDQRLTNTGGGNTSVKVQETDPVTGKPVQVLWVKGSGGDLRTSGKSNFSSLHLDKLMQLQQVYAAQELRGPKTPAEDRMVDYLPHCTYNLNPRAASIDTPLHGFVPLRHIDHLHPNSVIAIAAAARSQELTQEIFGEDVAWVPWLRPGFELGLQLQQLWRDRPHLKGVVLGKHGILNGADDAKGCYDLSLELIEKAARYIEARDKGEKTFGGQKHPAVAEGVRQSILAEILPWLRGKLSERNRMIATVHDDAKVLQFVSSHDAARLTELGTSCPDHFLRTKIKPLFVDWNSKSEDVTQLKELLEQGLAKYRLDYEAYYNRCCQLDSPAMRDPNPTVVLIPGLGMIAWGKNKSESRTTAEFYNCAIEVMRGAEAIDRYTSLDEQEAFDIEYWRLEEAKLQRMPKEKALARRIVLIVGAGSGIGVATAHRLAAEGAHIVCADLKLEAAQQTADELNRVHGAGIGVAGTGISACGNAVAVEVDITDRDSVRRALDQTILAYGGLDHVVVTAGIYVPPTVEGSIEDHQWKQTFDINVFGHYVVVDEAKRVWLQQGLAGSLVLTTSVNGFVAKRGSLAYDASKAAANHLVRELAIDLAPLVRVNGVAPATVVVGSSMFPRQRVISSLAKYGIAWGEQESDDALRDKLARYYAQRTLTKVPVTPQDQAEAIAFLIGEQSRLMSGQVLAVDGGLPEANQR